jgi:hypothetical protein
MLVLSSAAAVASGAKLNNMPARVSRGTANKGLSALFIGISDKGEVIDGRILITI